MIFWKDIPDAVKLTGAVLIAWGGLTAYLTSYQTDAEAQAYQSQNAEQIALFRVQQIEAMIAQYRYQLLSTELTPAQREWILTEIRRLEGEINCIRNGTC